MQMSSASASIISQCLFNNNGSVYNIIPGYSISAASIVSIDDFASDGDTLNLLKKSPSFTKDFIKIGDEIVCFNPNTLNSSISKVINHYNRITNKIVYNIKIISGRYITATYDHKFMTNIGWIEVKNFDKGLKLGINIGPDYQDNSNYLLTLMTSNLDSNISNYLNSIGLYPLYNNHYNTPIIARLVGYYINNSLSFKNEIDIHPEPQPISKK